MSKYEIERVQKALDYAKKRLNSEHLHFTVRSCDDPEMGDFILAIHRTSRGMEDPEHFVVLAHPKNAAAQSMKQLRSAAMHEVFHARLFGMFDFAPAAKQKAALLEFEKVVYWLERLFGGDK